MNSPNNKTNPHDKHKIKKIPHSITPVTDAIERNQELKKKTIICCCFNVNFNYEQYNFFFSNHREMVW